MRFSGRLNGCLDSGCAANRLVHLFLILVLVLAAAGCAPTLKSVEIPEAAVQAERAKQREMALSIFMERQERLFDISFPLLSSSAEMCGKAVRPAFGFMLHDKEIYKKIFGDDYARAAARILGARKDVTVRYVNPEFPAAGAGLRVGDNILAINGKSLDGKNSLDAMKMVYKLVNSKEKRLSLRIKRRGKVSSLTMSGVLSCKYPVLVANDDRVNAHADGKRVVIATGMVRFAGKNEELALVISHEIAHNALGHMKKRYGNVILGSILDILIASTTGIYTQNVFARMGTMAFSKSFEAEADYMGLYIAARAGFDITDAANFWRRMAVEHPGGIEKSYSSFHPSTAERFIAVDKTVREIEEKRRRGKALLPDKKARPRSQAVE